MKKVLMVMGFGLLATGAFASKDVKKDLVEKQEVKIEKAISTEPDVHLEGTLVSSCGIKWHYTYECQSGCSVLGTMQNMAALVQAINATCGTSQTSVSLSFDNG